MKDALAREGSRWSQLADEGGGGVRVATMHGANGLEFARLAVVGLNADAVPLPVAVTPEGDDPLQQEHDMSRERCLLYVAYICAPDELMLTGSGPPSASPGLSATQRIRSRCRNVSNATCAVT